MEGERDERGREGERRGKGKEGEGREGGLCSSNICLKKPCYPAPPQMLSSNMQVILHYWLVNIAQWILFGNTIIFVPGLLETS